MDTSCEIDLSCIPQNPLITPRTLYSVRDYTEDTRPLSDFQMTCNELTRMGGYQDCSPKDGRQVTCHTEVHDCNTINDDRMVIFFDWNLLTQCSTMTSYAEIDLGQHWLM